MLLDIICNDVLDYILTWLDPESIRACNATCRGLRTIINNNPILKGLRGCGKDQDQDLVIWAIKVGNLDVLQFLYSREYDFQMEINKLNKK